MKKIVPKSCFFVFPLTLDSECHKQLVPKPETCLGFKTLGNHQHIKRKTQNNWKCQK